MNKIINFFLKKKKSFFIIFIYINIILFNNISFGSIYKDDEIVKTIENKEKVIVIYKNKTEMFINKLLNNLKDLFWHLNTLITLYEDDNSYKDDVEFLKLKSFYADEIKFIKGLREKGIELKEDEILSFFNFIGAGKIKAFFDNDNKDVYTKLLFVNKKGKKENLFYKIILNIDKQNIIIQEKKEEKFETVYGGKIYIPKNSMIYKSKLIYSESVNIPYIIVWFYTKTGIGVSIMSISSNDYGNINLVSDVTGIFINNSTGYYAYKQSECEQKLKYFYVKEGVLYGYCLNKNNKTILENVLIK